MIDLLALITVMAWPVIPLFWIPVHFATDLFRKLGLLTYVMPLITWIPLAYFVYSNRIFLLQFKADLPLICNVIGVPLFICGILLHIWTARLLGIRGIIGVPEISGKVRENLVGEGPFSIVRHPTYLAHTLIFSGVFLITASVAAGVIALVDFVVVNAFIMPLEEKELSNRFAEGYAAYKKKVPSKFFPWIHRR
jgi:protein-S-isoprenylcysteine O-methyltransferase Ste14